MLRDYAEVRAKLLNREEIAFLDVREEAPHAEGHPLFAANFPLVRLELDAATKLPRRDVPIVTFDNGEGLAEQAAERLLALGYSDVAVFAGGLDGWKAAGGEVFIDVNVPSKAFGELMEAACHTPSFSAQEVKAMLDAKADMVIVDVRRFDEYQTMSIPTGISVPGAEVVLRVADLVRKPTTQIIVNCAGRTRSLIGTQSLINAGFPNPIAALRNGTIGWLLAQQQLDFGQTRRFSATSAPSAGVARQRARAVADRAGVKRASKQDWATWMQQDNRTTYCFDVRNVAEYATGHLPGCYPIPGGQLVQETEMYAPVRGARLLLVDDDGTRANMSASWLAQMAWDVYVIDGLTARDFSETGYEKPKDSPPMRRYQRPYEGTDAPPLAMQAYLDWEFGLIEQLRRDGTHHFQPLKAE